MTIVNEILNILFLYKINKISKLKFNKMEQFNEYIENLKNKIVNNKFENLTDYDREIIRNIILNYNYPKKLKKPAIKLYKHTDIDNLLFCAVNLLTVTLEKSFVYREINGCFLVSEGSYYSLTNEMRYHEKDAIPHEFLHMSSRTLKTDKNLKTGFANYKNKKCFAQGLNEGCTEMLSRKIFFNENYNGNSYTTKVYAIRLLELLYDNITEMERDYLRADFESFKNTFLNYGSESELEKIIYALDFPEWHLTYEEKIGLIMYIKNIVNRKQGAEEKTKNIVNEFKTKVRKL